MDVRAAIKRPFTNPKVLAIGIIISVIMYASYLAYTFVDASPFLVMLLSLPITLVLGSIIVGYGLEVAKSSVEGKKDLPAWKNFKALFVRGFVASVISMIYLIPIILLLVLFILSPLGQLAFTGVQDATAYAALGAGLGTSLLLILVVAILAIILGYFVPAAYINYAIHNKFKAGFDFKTIKAKAMTGRYFAAWLVGLLYTLGLSFAFNLAFFFFPPVGMAIGAFIGSVTRYSLLGEAWASIK